MAPHVLLVDDEVDFTSALAERLRRRGFEVSIAPGGEEGLRLARAGAPDVVVLDVRMPGLDGLEVLRRLKRERPGLEVILLTGHASVEHGIEGMREGASDYLLKPVPMEDLVARLQSACERAAR